MDELCETLGNIAVKSVAVAEESERSSAEELSAFTQALNKLLRLIEEILDDGGVVVFARMMVVVAGHTGQHYWTNSVNRQLATEVLATLCTKYQHLNCESMLAKSEELLSAILDYIKEVLTKSSWKVYPVHKQALVWVMKCLKHPNLSPHLHVFLPPTLWMLDDYSDYHRTLALSCITHIIQQMDQTELRWQGRDQLLYQAMKPLLYISSSSVVYALHPCLLKLLPILDYCSTTPTIPAKPKTIDEVFCVVLDAMAKESKFPLQRAYASQLKGYICQLGIYSARHIKQCLPLLLCGLEHPDPDRESLRKHCLRALSALISVAWPRIPTHKITVLKALSKLVHNLGLTMSENASHMQDDGILGLIVECLALLMAACPELEEEYKWLEKSCNHPTMQFCLQQTLNSK